MPPYTATLNLTITAFAPINQGTVSYGMTLSTETPEIFELIAPPPSYQLIVTKPVNDPNPVDLTFSLNDSAYVLIGIYFTAIGSPHPVGRLEFPTITIDREIPDSTMVVSDAAVPIPEAYTYAILVQQAATGHIGIIDPIIVNRPGPPT